MPAPKGNSFWKARTKHGRDKIMASPEALWDACCEYFVWNENTPLWEEKLFLYQGVVVRDCVSKMRAMTIEGLCRFIDIDPSTWRTWRNDEDFSAITTRVDGIIRDQKFTGAAADLFNANIIARDLGLRDKAETDHTSSDRSMSPQGTTINVTDPIEAAKEYQKLMG